MSILPIPFIWEMALSSIFKKIFWAAFVYIVLVSSVSCDLYHRRTNMPTYSTGEELVVTVNSLTSTKARIPFSYYSLPYCKPIEGIKRRPENVGQLLMGDQVVNSPYRFKVNVNESLHLCTIPPLSDRDAKLLKQRTRYLYRVNMILDNFPATRSLKRNGIDIRWTGFLVGYTPWGSEDDYVINHVKFRVLIRDRKMDSKYEIVGFEVVPCSVRYDHDKMRGLGMYDNVPRVNCPLNLDKSQLIREKEEISFTYEVEFVKSNIKRSSRWDAFLKMEGAHTRWFSIGSTLVVIFLLSGRIFLIFSRTVRRGLLRYKESDGRDREPNHLKLLCVMVGDGVQILGTAAITTVLAVVGFTYPASRGSIGGYVGVRLWITIKGTLEGWKSISWSCASFFPGIVLAIFTALNLFLCGSESTRAIPFSLYLFLLSLWFCICVPLTLVGGYLATTTHPTKFPVETCQLPRGTPAWEYLSWLRVLVAGMIPFGTLFVELFYIMCGLWLGRLDYAFGVLLIVLMLLVVVCAEVSVILTRKQLNVEDWRGWWWKAFYGSGSAGVYVFFYSIYFLVFDLRSSSGPVSVILYLGSSLIIALMIMLATGSIGFLASLCFVRYLYSVVKAEAKDEIQRSISGEGHETFLVKN